MFSLAPNGSRILRPSDFNSGEYAPQSRSIAVRPADFLPSEKEEAAAYAAPQIGSSPVGLGYTFTDAWKRTGRGTMEFMLPMGQTATINNALRCARENVFVGKAMRLKTDFTCKGLRNATADDTVNSFLDNVIRKLTLRKIYRNAVWLYYTAGLVPILFPEPDQSMSFAQIIDPRFVKVQEWYGKKFMYLKPDRRMIDAVNDKNGTSSIFNRDYYNAMPASWRKQIADYQKANPLQRKNFADDFYIRLTPGSYTVIQNRDGGQFSVTPESWDGCPLQPYFSACEQYRMLMQGDFASAFLAKNLIALVSIGDPKAEGAGYLRPDDTVLSSLQGAFQNANDAMWVYGDPTINVRYITPETDTFSSDKYDEARSLLRELLPSCFWYGEDGSFANSQTSMKFLQEEVDACNQAFDEDFWRPIFERASDANTRVAKGKAKPPLHDHNALKDDFQYLQAQSGLYSNGGLDLRTLVELHGHDWEGVVARLKEQQALVKKGVLVPAYEGKQGIVTGIYEKNGVIEGSANEPQVPKTPLNKVGQLDDGTPVYGQQGGSTPASGSTPAKKTATKRGGKRGGNRGRKKPDGGKGGGVTKQSGAKRPQPESAATRAPRPGGK